MILEARAILDSDKIKRLTERFKEVLGFRVWDITELMCSASLAHHDLFSYLWDLTLSNVDMSPIPAQNLASLASCVTDTLKIKNVSGCGLVSILTSLKCYELHIWRQSLGVEETQALVLAMESGVERVRLCGEVTLDIEALTEYSGQGRCWEVRLWDETVARNREELRTWAKSRNWHWRIENETDEGDNHDTVRLYSCESHYSTSPSPETP